MDDIDVNDYDSYSLHMLFSLWRLFPKNKQNHASKAIQFIYCRKDDLFLRSNILPERKRDGTLGRCSIYRLYNSSTKNFAAGYQSTRSFVKLGNSSNTTAGAAIFCCCTCFFLFFLVEVEILKNSPVDWVDQNTKWNQDGPLGPKPLWSRPKGVLL